MFGEIALSVCYNSFYSHDFNNKTANGMRKDMNEPKGKEWKKFQINVNITLTFNVKN